MSAIQLHNALFMSDPDRDVPLRTLSSPPPRTGAHLLRPHSRHLSSYSSTTVHSARDSYHQTEGSQTNTLDSSTAQLALLPRSLAHMGRHSGVDVRRYRSRDSQAPEARRLGRWKRRAKWGLELVIGGWACYNTVRYYLGYNIYHSHDRRVISLALGASTSLSLALLVASMLLSQPFARRALRVVRLLLSYTASALLFAPAVVNLVLVFVWRHATDPYVALRGRCHWDIDVVWTGVGAQCKPPRAPPWGAWLAASLVRLIATVIVLGAYHITNHFLPRSKHHVRKASDTAEGRHIHVALPTTPESWARTESTTPMATISSPLVPRRAARHGAAGDTTPPISPEPDTRPYRPSPLAFVLDAADEDSVVSALPESAVVATPLSGPQPSSSHTDPAELAEAERIRRRMADMELIQFAAQFRSIVHQMQQETADGLDLGGDTTPQSEGDEREEYFPAPAPEAGRVVLGRYVRRMSTIESLGSREADRTTVHSAHPTASGAYSPHSPASSRPPTRLTTRTASEPVSAPPSRSNSLTLGRAVADAGALGGGRASPGLRSVLPPADAAEQRPGGRASPALWGGRASPVPPSPADSGLGWAGARRDAYAGGYVPQGAASARSPSPSASPSQKSSPAMTPRPSPPRLLPPSLQRASLERSRTSLDDSPILAQRPSEEHL